MIPAADHQIQSLAEQQAASLRVLADMIEQNPELAQWFQHALGYSGISVHLSGEDDKAATMARIARVARRYGANVTKDINDRFHNLILDFGGCKACVLAYRDEVCERVVTGTEMVTKTVKDPAAIAALPDVEVTEVVETVEWVCQPLLAADSRAVAS